MPKIDAPTVAQHHARQRRALLDAATSILETDGVGALTPAAVGRRAGLARSSVYQYFSSAAEIIASVVEETFPPANDAVAEALAGMTDPRRRIDTYVRTTLRLAAAGAHRVAAALNATDLPAPCVQRLRELHEQQAQPLFDAIADLGAADPTLTTALVGGLVQAAVAQVDAGRPADDVADRTLQLLDHGLCAVPVQPDTGGERAAAGRGNRRTRRPTDQPAR